MRSFILLMLFSYCTATAQTNSTHIHKVPFSYMKVNEGNLCVHRSGASVIQTDPAWMKVHMLCKDDSLININFNENTVWQRSSMGDCRAIFTHILYMDTVAKKMIWEEHKHYGGCRAAKFEDFRIVFRKPPDGYTFETTEVLEK